MLPQGLTIVIDLGCHHWLRLLLLEGPSLVIVALLLAQIDRSRPVILIGRQHTIVLLAFF